MDNKKYTIFISDTHFNEKQPRITERFLKFLELNLAYINALYLLGDLFNTWIGDDNDSPLIQRISQALADCAKKGILIYFIHGNRDYLIGKTFAKRCNMILLPQETCILLYHEPTLIMHGDTLCTEDKSYQLYRKIMFSRWMKAACLFLPLSWRKAAADRLRKASQKKQSTKSYHIIDVSEKSVIESLKKHQTQWLIHGHTHRPNHHKINQLEKTAHRLVLGAWSNTEGSAIIASKEKKPYLIRFDQPPILNE